jgi:hypothetical protein
MNSLSEKISRGIDQKIRLDIEVGELLKKAKTTIEAGREPDASIAPAIRAKHNQAKALAMDVGRMLTRATPDEVRQAMGKTYDETIIASYIEYASNPTSDSYDKTLDALLAVTIGQGRFGTGIGRRK